MCAMHKSGDPPRNCKVISFLMTKRAQNTSKKVNSTCAGLPVLFLVEDSFVRESVAPCYYLSKDCYTLNSVTHSQFNMPSFNIYFFVKEVINNGRSLFFTFPVKG